MTQKYINAASYSCPSAVMKKTHFAKTCILQLSLCCYEENPFCKNLHPTVVPVMLWRKPIFCTQERVWKWWRKEMWVPGPEHHLPYVLHTSCPSPLWAPSDHSIVRFKISAKVLSHRTKNFSKIKNSFRSSKAAVSTVIADLQRPKQNNYKQTV